MTNPKTMTREETIKWFFNFAQQVLQGNMPHIGSHDSARREDIEEAADLFRERLVSELSKVPSKITQDLDPSDEQKQLIHDIIVAQTAKNIDAVEAATERLKDVLVSISR